MKETAITTTEQQDSKSVTLADMRPKPPASTENVRVGYDSTAGWELSQRVAKCLAASSLVPDVYRGNVADCTIALNMAARIGADPLMVMQHLYLVHGRPAWSSQFAIASLNSCGRFEPIAFKFQGIEGKDEWGCRAILIVKKTGEVIEGPLVTLGIAKKEGWYDRKGSKWQTMPELMLRYRAAAFLARTTAPELMLGMHTVEEEIDRIIDVTPMDAATQSELRRPVQVKTGVNEETVEALAAVINEQSAENSEQTQEEQLTPQEEIVGKAQEKPRSDNTDTRRRIYDRIVHLAGKVGTKEIDKVLKKVGVTTLNADLDVDTLGAILERLEVK